MDVHAWIAVVTLLCAVTLFISKWIPLEATALGIPVVLGVTGTLDADQCLKGFGNHAVIALGAIFILGAGYGASRLSRYAAADLYEPEHHARAIGWVVIRQPGFASRLVSAGQAGP